LHARIAEALEAHSPEIINSQPELLAQHYAEAGLVERSVAFWGKAGRRSTVARSAMAEAAAQFKKGLDQLALLPNTPERHRQELEFCSALAAVLNVVKGFAARETGLAYARAQEMWEQLGSPLEFLGVPYGKARYHMFRGEFDLVLRLDEGLLRLSKGPLVSFARSNLSVRWGPRFQSLLEFAEACDVAVRWSCRTGVCHNCETALVAGVVGYRPYPVEPPAEGNVLICCSQPQGDIVVDL
jgi:ferredoxin